MTCLRKCNSHSKLFTYLTIMVYILVLSLDNHPLTDPLFNSITGSFHRRTEAAGMDMHFTKRLSLTLLMISFLLQH